MPAEDVLLDRQHGPERRGEHAGEVAPERAHEREDAEDRGDREHPDAVREDGRRLAAQRQERAVERRHRRVLAERHAEHPERVVDQQRALRADLVGVEQVLGPVVAGDGSPPITRCWSTRARAPAPAARPAATGRSARSSGRAASGQGSSRPTTTSAGEREPDRRRVERRRRALERRDQRDRARGEAEHRRGGEHGQRALAHAPGRSGASARPGASTSAASESSGADAPGRAEQGLERHEQRRRRPRAAALPRGAPFPEYGQSEMRTPCNSARPRWLASALVLACRPRPSAQGGNGLYEPFPKAAVEKRAKRFVRAPAPRRAGPLLASASSSGARSSIPAPGRARPRRRRPARARRPSEPATADVGPRSACCRSCSSRSAHRRAAAARRAASAPPCARPRLGARSPAPSRSPLCLGVLAVLERRRDGEAVGRPDAAVPTGLPRPRRRGRVRQPRPLPAREARPACDAAGAGLMRQTFDWARSSARPGRYDFSLLRRLRRGRSRGGDLRVLPILFNPPRFRSSRAAGRRAGAAPTRRGRAATWASSAPRSRAATARAASFWQRAPGAAAAARPLLAGVERAEPPRLLAERAGRARSTWRCCAPPGDGIRARGPGGGDRDRGPADSRLGVPLRRYVGGDVPRGRRRSLRHAGRQPVRAATATGRARTPSRLVRGVAAANGDRPVGAGSPSSAGRPAGRRARFLVSEARQARADPAQTLLALARRRDALRIRGVVYFNWRDSSPYCGRARTSSASTRGCCASTGRQSQHFSRI